MSLGFITIYNKFCSSLSAKYNLLRVFCFSGRETINGSGKQGTSHAGVAERPNKVLCLVFCVLDFRSRPMTENARLLDA